MRAAVLKFLTLAAAVGMVRCTPEEPTSPTDTGGSPGASGGSAAAQQGGNGPAASGGITGSGGATSAGGVAPASGGAGAGGAATGGRATGGTATGGSTGGTSTGGTATGGRATGGAATGGTASGSGLPALHVEGALVKDPTGKVIVLRGVDLIDIGALYAYNGQTASAITQRIDKILAAGFQPHVVRIPVYPRVSYNTPGPSYSSPAPFPVGTGGVQNGPSADQYVANLLKPTVDYLTQKGMYVIIDYHQIDNTNGQSATDATTFWQYMAAKFASYSNVLYEPFNEPIDQTTAWATFKTRAQGWVDTIRSAAPNNLIIVPSMSWCQHPGDAANSPLTGTNLMYTAHVYPGNWNSTFQQQVTTAVAKIPVFITEWGYILNSSDTVAGTSDANWSTNSRTFVDNDGASWSAWVTDNAWTPNMFSDTALTTLTDFGSKTKTWLQDKLTSNWVQ